LIPRPARCNKILPTKTFSIEVPAIVSTCDWYLTNINEFGGDVALKRKTV